MVCTPTKAIKPRKADETPTIPANKAVNQRYPTPEIENITTVVNTIMAALPKSGWIATKPIITSK